MNFKTRYLSGMAILSALTLPAQGLASGATTAIPLPDMAAEQQKQPLPQSGFQVTGMVTDANREPLIGVTVRVVDDSKNLGTVTDIDGMFQLNVPSKNAKLELTYVGYKKKTVNVNGNRIVNVVMEEDTGELDEVVVVAYGAQKKASIIGAITTTEPENLDFGTSRTLTNNLAGKLSGVLAVQRSGEPGYDESNFWIRGISTFSGGNRPLVLVDGVERDLNNVDIAEIESISVLKDASASAMYGVRGANGVIIVTTKHGQIGAPKVRVHLEQSINQPTKFPEFLNAPDYMTLLNELAAQDGAVVPFDQQRIDRTRSGYDPDLYPDVNWIDAITKDYAYTTKGVLDVSGGSDFLRYSIVGSYFHETGILEQDKTLAVDNSTNNNQINLRSNIDMNVTKTTLLRVNIGGNLNRFKKQRCSTDGAFDEAFATLPFVHPARYSDGAIPRENERANPWSTATQGGYDFITSSKIQTLFSVEQDLRGWLPGLKAKGLFSYDRWNSSRRSRTRNAPTVHPATGRDPEGNLMYTIYNVGDDSMGQENESNYGNTRMYFEFNVNYSGSFGKNDIDALLLYNLQSYDDGSFQEYRKLGLAGRVSYTYDTRYIAEVNFGYNGSENFAKGHRFGFFPSLAVGWLITNERFMEPVIPTLNKLKIRASIGKAGNDNIGGRRFAYLTTLNTGADGYTWGTTGQKGYGGISEGDIGVTNLTWETAVKSNLGIEIGLWNAIDLTFDIFKEKRKDIFMQRNIIPTQTGFITNPWANFGKMTNGGFEITLNARKQFNKDWFTSFYGNFTYAKNRVDQIDEAPMRLGTYRGQTGRSLGELWGLTAERLFTADDFDESGNLKFGIPTQEVGASKLYPGDIKYVDMNGDGKITEEDEGYIGGTVDPRIVYGFGGVIGFKNIDFNFFFQGAADTHRVIGNSAIFLPGSGTTVQGNAYSANLDDRWTDDNQDPYAFWPRLSYGPNKNNYRASTWWKKDMSFLRLKTIEIGYSLPKTWMEKIYVRSARVFVSGNNLFCFTPFKLWDPELGTDNGLKYPVNKSVMFGLDVNF